LTQHEKRKLRWLTKRQKEKSSEFALDKRDYSMKNQGEGKKGKVKGDISGPSRGKRRFPLSTREGAEDNESHQKRGWKLGEENS